MPCIHLGVYLTAGKETTNAVRWALEVCTKFDTERAYPMHWQVWALDLPAGPGHGEKLVNSVLSPFNAFTIVGHWAYYSVEVHRQVV